MPFTQATFAPVGPQAAPSPTAYSYSTTDSSTTVMAAGYFSSKQNQLNEGDYIFAVTSSGTFTFVVSASTDTVIVPSDTLNNRVIVTQASQLSGALDSTKEYFIDGFIDMGSQSITIPVGGLNINGYDFDISKLFSTENNYTMFISPIGGSGNLIGNDCSFEVSGTSSQVYNIVDSGGTHAIELIRVNYVNCTSLGTIDGYRQGLETGTGRFGGSPSLTLEGTWIGGFRITTSITRSLASGMTGALFQKGAAFTMASRFLTDMNVDLPPSAALLDFESANFTDPSLLQLQGMIVTRGFVSDASDSNYTPNITQTDIASKWDNNQGLNNTFEGGKLTIGTEVTTTFSGAGAYTPLLGTFNATELQHFDEPSNGQLRHLGDNPREYTLVADLPVNGTANDIINIGVRVFDVSAGTSSSMGIQKRIINNLAGPRNVAFFTITSTFTLDQNDYVYLEAANELAGNSIASEVDGFFQVTRR